MACLALPLFQLTSTVSPEGGASGVMVAQGGAFAGWSLYLTKGSRSTATTWPG